MSTKTVENSIKTPFVKGHPKMGGRKRGTANKLTKSAKEAFQVVFDKKGGTEGLLNWANKNEDDFYKLYARLIPTDVTTNGQSITGVEVTIK